MRFHIPDRVQSLRFFSPRVRFGSPVSLKLVFAFLYAIVCSIIILPQLDYQTWYPKGLGIHDSIIGPDVSRHTQVTLDLSDSDIDSSQLRETVSIINSRLAGQDISSATTAVDATSLTYHLPGQTSEAFITGLTAPGVVQLMSTLVDIDTEANPTGLFDPANYEQADLRQADVSEARVTSQTEQYVYIDLDIISAARKRWAKLVDDTQEGNIGVMVDGSLIPAWIMASSSSSAQSVTKTFTLVVLNAGDQISFIPAYFKYGPLPITLAQPQIESVASTFTQAQLYSVGMMLAGALIVAFAWRFFFEKNSRTVSISSGLIVLGVLSMVKLSSIPLTLPLVAILLLISLLVQCVDRRMLLPLFLVFIIMSFPLRFSLFPDADTIGRLLFGFGAFGSLSILFYSFFDIYEENK